MAISASAARALALVAAFAFSACAPSTPAEPPGPQTFAMVGSSTVLPLTNAVLDSYRAAHADDAALVELSESGTSAGFEQFCANQAAINGASRPILSREMIACYRQGVRYVEIPVAFDAITIIVHPSNPLTSITLNQLQAIWEPQAQGVTTSWRQADSRWPDAPLALFGPGGASGTFDYFSDAIMGEIGLSRTDYRASEHDEDIVAGVAGEPNAIGYVGFAHFLRNGDRLKALEVDAGEGPVAPNPDTVRSGAYHPLSRPIFIYVNASALDRPEVAQFVEYYVANAGSAAEAAGYVALPEAAYANYLERVRARRYGSAFSGGEATGESIEEVLARPLIEPAS